MLTDEKQGYAIRSLLRRASMMLEQEEYAKAIVNCDEVIRRDETNVEGYLIRLLASKHIKQEQELEKSGQPLDESEDYQKIMIYGDDAMKARLQGYNHELIYLKAKKFMESNNEQGLEEAIAWFEGVLAWKNSEQLKQECELVLKQLRISDDLRMAAMMLEQGEYDKTIAFCGEAIKLDETNTEAYLTRLMASVHVRHEEELEKSGQPLDESEDYQKIMDYGNDAVKERLQGYNSELIYQKAIKSKESNTEQGLEEAIVWFEGILAWKDSEQLKQECELVLKQVRNIRKLANAKEKDIVQFGRYWQDEGGKEKTPIDWIVLDKQRDRLLLISKNVLDCKPYNTAYVNVTWGKCSLREWLNAVFYNEAFDESVRNNIAESKVIADKNSNYSTDPGKDTQDRVFLLSIAEARKYFRNDKDRRGKPNPYAIKHEVYINNRYNSTCWWLRSPGYGSYYAARVLDDGSVSALGINVHIGSVGVRPALWLKL